MSNPNESSQIAQGTVIKGTIKSTEDIRIDGIVEGDLTTQGKLIVGETGFITGNLKTETIIVAGEFKVVNIDSVNLTFQKNARFTGEATYQNLMIETGAQVNGNLSVKK